MNLLLRAFIWNYFVFVYVVKCSTFFKLHGRGLKENYKNLLKILNIFSIHKNVTALKIIISSPLRLEVRTSSDLENGFPAAVV